MLGYTGFLKLFLTGYKGFGCDEVFMAKKPVLNLCGHPVCMYLRIILNIHKLLLGISQFLHDKTFFLRAKKKNLQHLVFQTLMQSFRYHSRKILYVFLAILCIKKKFFWLEKLQFSILSVFHLQYYCSKVCMISKRKEQTLVPII